MDIDDNRLSPFGVLDPAFNYQQNIDEFIAAPDIFVDELFSQLSPEEQMIHDHQLSPPSSLYPSTDTPSSTSTSDYPTLQHYLTSPQQPQQQQPTIQLPENSPNFDHSPSVATSFLKTEPKPEALSLNIEQISLNNNHKRDSDWLQSSPDQSFGANQSQQCLSGDESDGNSSSNSQKPANPKRRKAHNVIEKRYRLSINKCIEELKRILAPEQNKMSKSATLKMAIDEISGLRVQNEQLKQQLNALQAQQFGAHNNMNNNTLAAPSMEMSSPSSVASSTSPQPAAPPSRRAGNRDGGRLMLLAILCGWMVLNPLQSIIPGAQDSLNSNGYDTQGVPGSRVILSHGSALVDSEVDSSWFDDGAFRFLCLWLLNGLVVMFVLARLLIFGEPVSDSKSTSGSQVTAKRHRAEALVAQDKPDEACAELCEALTLMGCPLPIGLYEEWSSVAWQICRHALNLCYVGRWIPNQRDKVFKGQSMQRSTEQASFIYSMIHSIQLQRPQHLQYSNTQLLSVALSAMNFAEQNKQADDRLYVSVAIQCKLSLASSILRAIVSRYFLYRASGTNYKSHSWLFSTSGLNFWKSLTPKNLRSMLNRADRSKQEDRSMFIETPTTDNDHDIFPHLFAGYKMYMLEDIVQSIVHGSDSSDYISSLKMCQTLLVNAPGDQICSWWSNVAACAALWLADDISVANERYNRVRRIPESLMTDPLAMAVGHAFCCRKVCQENKHQKHYERVVFTHVRKAFDFLAQTPRSKYACQLEGLLKSLCYDWMLSSCTDVWTEALSATRPHWTQPVTRPMLLFQYKLLNMYEQHAKTQTTHADADKEKLHLHRTCVMMRSGRQPLLTWQCLQQCARGHLSHAHTDRMLTLAHLHHVTPPGF